MDNQILKRTFGMREAVTITVGTVVGVGLFTTGANVVGMMGSAVIIRNNYISRYRISYNGRNRRKLADGSEHPALRLM